MKILVATALGLEFDAVKTYLQNCKPEIHPVTKSPYLKGQYNSSKGSAEILVFETGAGNVRAAEETTRAIDYFQPDYAFFVGVAGGIKDVKLGDVVASTKVIGYEMGKDEDSEFKPRLDVLPAAYELEQVAKEVNRERQWQTNIDKLDGDPDVFIQPIAAGEKVVASDKAVAYQYIRKYCSDAVAVAMEGNGFMIAIRTHHGKGIEIRGISDMIVDKEEADAGGSQPRAADHAVAFMFAMIENLLQNKPKLVTFRDPEVRKNILNLILERYPQGPEQNDIWKRAGGDVSIFYNSSSRRSQWYNGLEMIALGGGGNGITWEKLLNTINEDFPGFIG